MKNILIVLLCVVGLIACNESENSSSKLGKTDNEKSQPVKKDPVAQTITQQEVSRIALVEAKQFISNAKEKGIDFSSAMTIYNSAQQAYDGGEYKKAQKLAVSVRHLIEDLLIKK